MNAWDDSIVADDYSDNVELIYSITGDSGSNLGNSDDLSNSSSSEYSENYSDDWIFWLNGCPIITILT